MPIPDNLRKAVLEIEKVRGQIHELKPFERALRVELATREAGLVVVVAELAREMVVTEVAAPSRPEPKTVEAHHAG